MNLSEALLPLLPGGKGVVAIVGGGGKTSTLFRLAGEALARGGSILATTTTHMFDPRLEPSRPEGNLILAAELEAAFSGGPLPSFRPGLTLLFSQAVEGKAKGIHPSWLPHLAARWELILVEADGSKGLPMKAPAAYEPVLPAVCMVVGVLGLDGLGRPMDGRTVHRPELFQSVTGCAPGQAIGWHHLAALVRHPQGLFKNATGPRAVLLNKADRAPFRPTRFQLAELEADQVLLCSLASPEGVIMAVKEFPCP